MPKIIDKEERMNMILRKAIEVFSEVGYKDANLSLIAEECNLSRPTVYQYFKDKKEIYYYAVKKISDEMYSRYSVIAFRKDENEDEIDKLNLIIEDIFFFAKKNDSALSNLVEFILAEKKSGVDVYSTIMSRTAKLRLLIKRLLLKGIQNGRIKECDVEKVGDEIYSLVQAECFQVGFFRNYTTEEASSTLFSFISNYRKN